VIIVDASWVNHVLGSSEGLNKALETENADIMLSVSGHRHLPPAFGRNLFSADTNSEYWKLIRRGGVGAFHSKNIKYVSCSTTPSFLDGKEEETGSCFADVFSHTTVLFYLMALGNLASPTYWLRPYEILGASPPAACSQTLCCEFTID